MMVNWVPIGSQSDPNWVPIGTRFLKSTMEISPIEITLHRDHAREHHHGQ